MSVYTWGGRGGPNPALDGGRGGSQSSLGRGGEGGPNPALDGGEGGGRGPNPALDGGRGGVPGLSKGKNF